MAAPSKGRPFQPPPDYSSRSVQIRVFMLVAALMLVIVLMFEARKPENWRWMWQEDRVAEPALDTRPPLVPESLDEDGPLVAEPSQAGFDTAPRTLGDLQRHGWRLILAELTANERRRLRDAMKAARADQPIVPADSDAWRGLVARLDELWTSHHDQAFMAIARNTSRLDDGERRLWLTLLEQNRQAWPALKAALESFDSAGAAERASLEPFQATLDSLALERVRDDTVFRADDREAWFRLFERLREMPPGEIESASTGPATFVQLFGQPDIYRGRLVTVHGQVRLAYRMAAPRNDYGIDRYYAMWVKPAEGGDSPIAVYCLELPPGFPEVKDRDVDGETTPLSEDIAVTGYFFKRLVYASTSGANTAPLVVARQAIWTPALDPPSEAPPVAGALAAVIAAVLVAACLTTWWAFRLSAGRRPFAAPRRLASFDERSVQASARERLADLARSERPEGEP